MFAKALDSFIPGTVGSDDTTATRAFAPERRKRIRTRVHWPVLFFREETADTLQTVTQDLSSGGFYCLSRAPLQCGEPLLCALTVPTYEPGDRDHTVSLECRVRVVRSERVSEEGFFGIACQIEDFRFPARGVNGSGS